MAQGSLSLDTIGASRGGGPTDTAHDARLRKGIIETAVSRQVAGFVTALFLALIYVIPIGQAVLDKVQGEDSVLAELFQRMPSRDNLRQFEKDVEQASTVKDFVQPRAQLALSRLGRAGNKRAVIGHDGWLYYAPGVAHVAGPSFVDAEVIRSRANDVSDDAPATPHPDPRPAVLDFHRALAARGIRLVVFPVPDKAALEPAELDGRGNRALPMPVPNNVGYAAFVDALRREGVAIFDPAPVLLAPGEKPRFLEQDTHWTPEWMQEVAADLARFVEHVAPLPPAPKLSLRVTRERVGRVGDLVDMLKLPVGQTLFQPQHVTVQRVADEAGADWEPDPQGDVLLLGDSFTNIFSMDPMGWGTAAGLAPHLALALGRGVDVIAQNDSGAFATRQALARELGGDEDRLAGKRVVIWEFASRELSVGDWKPIDWSGRGARDARIEEGHR